MDAQHEEDAVGDEVHWSYEGDTGPGMWGSLDPSFAACDDGARQSPVDIAGAMAGGESELEIRWQAGDAEVIDNGHTIRVNVAEGSAVSLEGRDFALLQFHFHLPSEHTVEGSAAPMEVHFVHAAAEGDLAVIGVLMEAGEADPTVQSLWEAIPSAGESPGTLAAFDPRTLLPEGGSHYRYPGSLTTPACLEIVSWVVMTESIAVPVADLGGEAQPLFLVRRHTGRVLRPSRRRHRVACALGTVHGNGGDSTAGPAGLGLCPRLSVCAGSGRYNSEPLIWASFSRCR